MFQRILLLVVLFALAVLGTACAERIYSLATPADPENSSVGRIFVTDTSSLSPSWEFVSTMPHRLDSHGPYTFCLSVDKSLILAAGRDRKLSLYNITTNRWSNPLSTPDGVLPDGCVGRLNPTTGKPEFLTFYMRYPPSGRPYIVTRSYNHTMHHVSEGKFLLVSSLSGRVTSWSYSALDGMLTLSVGDPSDLTRKVFIYTCEVRSSSPQCDFIHMATGSYHAILGESGHVDFSVLLGDVTHNSSAITGYNSREKLKKVLTDLTSLGHAVCDDVKVYNVPSTESAYLLYAVLCPGGSLNIGSARTVVVDKRTGRVVKVIAKHSGYNIKSLST